MFFIEILFIFGLSETESVQNLQQFLCKFIILLIQLFWIPLNCVPRNLIALSLMGKSSYIAIRQVA
jgi:hypothetical protein